MGFVESSSELMMTAAAYVQLKIVVSVAAGLWKFSSVGNRFSLPKQFFSTDTIDGVGVEHTLLDRQRSNPKTYFRTSLWLPGVLFQFNLETWQDAFFKRNGLVIEAQTGELAFDSKYYIRSDSPSFLGVLKSERALRDAVAELFQLGAIFISFGDGYLAAQFSGAQIENRMAPAALAKLQKVLVSVGTRLVPGDDPFIKPVQHLTAVIYGLATYGFLSYAELVFTKGAVFVHWSDFLYYGLIAALAGLILFCASVFGILRSSSRAPRFLLEMALVLLLGGIPAGLGIFADLDRFADRRPELVVERVVRSLNTYQRRTKNGTRTEYQGCFDAAALAGRNGILINLPDCVELSHTDYDVLNQGDGVRFHVGRGFLGIPWYKQMQRLDR